MLLYKIEKPHLSIISEERKKYLDDNLYDIYFSDKLYEYSNDKYYYWDKIKYQKLWKNLQTPEELRYVIKKMRQTWIPTVIKSKEWKRFTLSKPIFLEELLHKIDLELWGNFFDSHLTKQERKVFLQNWIAEEAISSSQIEWALTSSKVAKDMINQWRKPITNHEKMIINNYNAMQLVNNEMKNQELTLELLIELQALLTKETLENPDYVGRLRKDGDEINVTNASGTKVYHIPPNEDILKKELENLIDFANDKGDYIFTHPFIKAVMLHFWIGYLHPFCDGNWRTARAIFYWYLLKKWYWGFSYIPISATIKNSKVEYGDAYLYSEQDDENLTYFLVYIAQKTILAQKNFNTYIKEKREKQKEISQELHHLGMNERQGKLIAYFLEKPKSYTNATIHKNYYSIAMNTAKTDLEQLFAHWILLKRKQWKYVNYYPIENLSEKLQ